MIRGYHCIMFPLIKYIVLWQKDTFDYYEMILCTRIKLWIVQGYKLYSKGELHTSSKYVLPITSIYPDQGPLSKLFNHKCTYRKCTWIQMMHYHKGEHVRWVLPITSISKLYSLSTILKGTLVALHFCNVFTSTEHSHSGT